MYGWGETAMPPGWRGHCCGDVCEVWEESALSDGGVDCATLLVADGGLDAMAASATSVAASTAS